MFWGITLESGKRYTQTIARSFNVTMAALGFSTANSDPVSVLVEIDQAHFVLCTLQAGKIPQQPLQLKFTEGEHVSFFIEGDGEIHLTGYLPPDPQEYNYSSDEEEYENEEDDEEIESELEELIDEDKDREKFIAALKKTKKQIGSPDFFFKTEESEEESDEENEEENTSDTKDVSNGKIKITHNGEKKTKNKEKTLPKKSTVKPKNIIKVSDISTSDSPKKLKPENTNEEKLDNLVNGNQHSETPQGDVDIFQNKIDLVYKKKNKNNKKRKVNSTEKVDTSTAVTEDAHMDELNNNITKQDDWNKLKKKRKKNK